MSADRLLVTIETVARLTAKAHVAITDGRTDDALFLLEAVLEETTLRTVAAQREAKDAQGASDEIAQAAVKVVRRVMAALEVAQAVRPQTPLESNVRKAVIEHFGAGDLTSFTRVAKAVRTAHPGMGLREVVEAVNADLARHGIATPVLSSRA